jgi:putative ABC transport system permease protein
VLPVRSVSARVADWPVEVVGFRDDATYRDNWPLIAAGPDPWDRVAAGTAALISEQLARRLALWPGATLTLPAPGGAWTLPVAAVYADYGNAEGQVMVAAAAFDARWPEADRRRLAVRVAPDAAARLAADLRAAFALPDGQVADQRAVKALSQRIFEQTFAVTVALNALTLAVAGVALLTSLLTLADTRLVQVAPLWASGVGRRRLAALELARALGLAGLTALLALPLGLALAWVLTAVVNVRAFGWRLPVLLLPSQWATVLALALATAALAALWPALRLARVPPRALLQEFGNER